MRRVVEPCSACKGSGEVVVWVTTPEPTPGIFVVIDGLVWICCAAFALAVAFSYLMAMP